MEINLKQHIPIDSDKLKEVIHILAEETLTCPKPYNFACDEFERPCPYGASTDCEHCWTKYLLEK